MDQTKRFKHVHGYESKIQYEQLSIINNSITFAERILLNIRVYQKNLFFDIPSGTSLSIDILPSDGNFWVYAFIDETATVRLGYTTIEPKNLSGSEFPSDPNTGQLFFNKTISRMFQWNGKNWIENDAVILGMFGPDGNCVNLLKRVSQGGFPITPFFAERIAKNRFGNFIRIFERQGHSFLTQAEVKKLGFRFLKTLSPETLIHRTTAKESMSALTVVYRDSDYTVSPCSNMTTLPGVALLLEQVESGEHCLILERGFFYTRSTQWPHPHNTPLSYAADGILTSALPRLNDSVAVQQVGHVVDINTIYFNPGEKFILEKP